MKLFFILFTCIILITCNSSNENSTSPNLLDNYLWTELKFPSAQFKYDDIYFIHPDTGWVVVNDQNIGYNPGQIMKTVDGGESWTTSNIPKPDGSREFFRSVGFLNSQVGFVGNLDCKRRP